MESVLESHVSESLELSKVRAGLETYRSYESRTKRKSALWVGGACERSACIRDTNSVSSCDRAVSRLEWSPDSSDDLKRARKGLGSSLQNTPVSKLNTGNTQERPRCCEFGQSETIAAHL